MPRPEYTLTKHRGKLALTYYEGAVQRKRSTGTDDPIRAESIARRLWEQLHAIQSERLDDLWPAYVRSRVNEGVREPRFHTAWSSLQPHFGHLLGLSVSPGDFRAYAAYRKSQGRSGSTIQTELALVKACLRWRYGKTNAPELELPPGSPPREHWLTRAEVRELHAATTTPHIKLFITLAVTTGARSISILGLTWDRVDFRSKTINYQPAGRVITNKRHSRPPINRDSEKALREAYEARLTDHVIEFNGKPITTVKKAFQRLSAKTGIKASPHIFRHSSAVWMAQDRVPISEIQQFLGHTSYDVTHRFYSHYHPDHLQKAATSTNFLEE